jgi:hypothetical protein
VVIPLLFVVAACGDETPASSQRSTAPATAPLATLPPAEVGEDALLVAVLEWDEAGNCVFGAAGSGERHPLVFPHGYAALADRHAIINEAGKVVGEEGDTVELGGGFHQLRGGVVGDEFVTDVPCPDGSAFLVQHPMSSAAR